MKKLTASSLKTAKRRTKNGFGLVEVLVAAGLATMIGLAISSVVVNANKQQKGIQAKDQQREITSEIRTLLGDRTACLNSFGGQDPGAVGPPTGFTVANIKDGSVAPGVALYNVNTNDKTGLLTFKEFRVNNWVPDAVGTLGRADLLIQLSKVDSNSGTATSLKPDVIALRVRRDTVTNKITECFSMAAQSDGIWQITPTNPNNIDYKAGNVGIGTDVPVSIVDIQSDSAFITIQPQNITANSQLKDSPTLRFRAKYDGIIGLPFGTSFEDFNITHRITLGGAGNQGRLAFERSAFEFLSLSYDDISGAKNVGIGNTSPDASYKLDVKGAIRSEVTPVATSYSVQLNSGSLLAAASGVTLGYGRDYNGFIMTDSGFLQAETQGTDYRNMLINPLGGNVGIGTMDPGSGTKLRIQGQMAPKSNSNGVSPTIDWGNGNSQTTSYTCVGFFNFVNLRDGGSYTLAVTSINTLQCNFSTATTGDDAATVVYKFLPPNATRTASSDTVYSLQRIGNTVYVSWLTGFL